MFKKSGKGFKRPFCINEACENFLPEDKRGYKKKTTPAENANEAPDVKPEEAKPEEKKSAKKAGAKAGSAKKPAAKKPAEKKSAGKSTEAKKKTEVKE